MAGVPTPEILHDRKMTHGANRFNRSNHFSRLNGFHTEKALNSHVIFPDGPVTPSIYSTIEIAWTIA